MSSFLDRIWMALRLMERTVSLMTAQGKSYWLIALFSFALNSSVLLIGAAWVKNILNQAPIVKTVQTANSYSTEIELSGPQAKALVWGIIFLLFLFAFIANVNRISTQRYTKNILLGQKRKFLKEWLYSFRFSLSLLFWLLIQCSIGLILSIIRGNRDEAKTPLGLIFKGIRSLLASGLALAWGTATFFVTPFIGFEGAGAWKAVKESTALMKQSFGESITATFSFQSLSWIVAVFSLGLCYVLPGASWPLGIIGGAYLLTMVWLAQEVFRTVLYLFVTGQQIGRAHV